MTSKIEQRVGDATEPFDYTTDAELFSSKFSRRGRQPLTYRRFVSAAEAIRFAIEDLPAQFLVGTYLDVGEIEACQCGNSPAVCEFALPAGAKGGCARMNARSLSETVVFSKPFLLKGVDRILPAGDYRVVTDEELIEGISFPAYRRVSTMIFVPAASRGKSIEMVSIDPRDLRIALDQDTAR